MKSVADDAHYTVATPGPMTVTDFDAWWERHKKRMHDQAREEFGAACPRCGADTLDALNEAAYDTDNMQGGSCCFDCPGCELYIEYDLEWETVITKATMRPTEEPTP